MYLIIGHCCLESTFLGVPEKKQLRERLLCILETQIGSNRRYRVDSRETAADGRLRVGGGVGRRVKRVQTARGQNFNQEGKQVHVHKSERPVSQEKGAMWWTGPPLD